MKLENVKSILKDELHQLGLVTEEVGDQLRFDYIIDQYQAPLHYQVSFDNSLHAINVRVHWDLVAEQLSSELLTFLSYLNSVEQYGHFYVESKDNKVYYKLSIFYRDFTPEIERTRRLFTMPVRAFGSGSNALRAILQKGEPVIDVYHWWIKEVLDTKEVERSEAHPETKAIPIEGAMNKADSSPGYSTHPEGDISRKGGTDES